MRFWINLKKRRMAIDWSELPQELLVQIVEDHMVSFDDFTMFSCVCRSWYRAAAACNLVKLRDKWSHHQMPWLMLTDPNDEIVRDNDVVVESFAPGGSDKQENDDNLGPAELLMRRKLWNVRKSKYYNICCPQGCEKVCWGSPYGWIVMTGYDDMYMFNPVSNSHHSLPCRRSFPKLLESEDCKSFLNKVVVLKVPKGTHGTLLVVAMYGYSVDVQGQGHVAIAYPGDLRWTGLEWYPTNECKPDLEDVSYHKDLGLLFVCKREGLVYCNLWDEEQPPLLKWYQHRVTRFLWAKAGIFRTYLTIIGDEIFMFQRVIVRNLWGHSLHGGYEIKVFKVYVLDLHIKKWRGICSLPQDVSVFVGDNTTMAVRAPDVGCESNRIYYVLC